MLDAVFTKNEQLFCAVPIPPIDAHKANPSVEFTESQISKYSQSQTHPSVLYFENGWNGHKWWLATTPYPSSTGVFENPCVYYADDQQDGTPPVVWTPIAGTASGDYVVVNNPVVKVANSSAVNSDPDLIMVGNIMHLISRDNNRDHAPFDQSSADGQAWTERSNLPLWLVSEIGQPELISQSIIKVGDKYRAYCCSGCTGWADYNPENNRGISWGIRIMEGTTFENGGDFTFKGMACLHGCQFIQPWHMDIAMYDNKYYMVVCGKKLYTDYKMLYTYMAISDDGVNFKMYARPLMSAYSYYRPSLCFKEDGELVVYGSTTNAPVTADELPDGAEGLSPDNRYIVMCHGNINEVISKLEAGNIVI